MITGNVIGAVLVTPDTFILQDENGKEYTAVMVEEEVDLNATANDIRLGTRAAGNNGVIDGEKVIPSYHTYQGARLVTAGSAVTIPEIDEKINYYDYTKLQSIICSFNSSISDSVSAEKVQIENDVYNVQSTFSIATVTKNHDSKLIDFGITNDSGTHWVNRFFMYKEIE